MQVGTRVKVIGCSGLDSGRTGIVVPKSEVKTNGRGVPLLPGHYKPMQSNESVIRDDNGDLFTMFNNRLTILPSTTFV